MKEKLTLILDSVNRLSNNRAQGFLIVYHIFEPIDSSLILHFQLQLSHIDSVMMEHIQQYSLASLGNSWLCVNFEY